MKNLRFKIGMLIVAVFIFSVMSLFFSALISLVGNQLIARALGIHGMSFWTSLIYGAIVTLALFAWGINTIFKDPENSKDQLDD